MAIDKKLVKASGQAHMIAVQCVAIEQSQKHLGRTIKPTAPVKQKRGTWAGNRSGIYN